MVDPPLSWRRSRRCEAHACLEVAFTRDRVLVRDSQTPAVPALEFTEDAWRSFCDALKRGACGADGWRPRSTMPS